MEVLEHAGCGRSVMTEVESRLNNIHIQARLLHSTCAGVFLRHVAVQSAI